MYMPIFNWNVHGHVPSACAWACHKVMIVYTSWLLPANTREANEITTSIIPISACRTNPWNTLYFAKSLKHSLSLKHILVRVANSYLVILNSWMHAHLSYNSRILACLLKCVESDRKIIYKHMPVLSVNNADTLNDSAEINNASLIF